VLCFKDEKERTIFTFPRTLAPYDCAVFPLVNKDGLDKKAKELKETLAKMGFDVFYDDSGSVGRRYRRADEIGISCCVTTDGQTLKDSTVTLRSRDDMSQVRVKIDDLCQALDKFLNGEELENLGEVVK
jgi:glycyl-tRNA synthetase